jgi:hypothetical protein
VADKQDCKHILSLLLFRETYGETFSVSLNNLKYFIKSRSFAFLHSHRSRLHIDLPALIPSSFFCGNEPPQIVQDRNCLNNYISLIITCLIAIGDRSKIMFVPCREKKTDRDENLISVTDNNYIDLARVFLFILNYFPVYK